MQKATNKTKSTRRSEGRPRKTVGVGKSPGRSRSRSQRKAAGPGGRRDDYPCVVENGNPTHVLVPLDEYELLVKASMVEKAIAQIERRDDELVNADDLALELAGERIARARKAAGLTQKQLGNKLSLPQSQISRIERNPDRTTVRTLKRIARALGVNVSALI